MACDECGGSGTVLGEITPECPNPPRETCQSCRGSGRA